MGEVNASITDESECEQEMTQPRSRKRVRCYENWKQNIRKRKRQAGEEYTIVKGNTQPQRKIKITKDCHGQCKFSCAKKFSKDEQESIFNDFWKLTDIEKAHFYSITTERNQKKRKRTNNEHSRKNFSFRYFFNKDEVKNRVCKKFYLGTLDISQKRVANYHKKAAQNVFIDRRGVHTKRSIPEETKAYIREHINSFPRMPSHYCRSNTKKEYLEAELTLARMYNLYVEKCQEESVVPAKSHLYRKIFNTEFNLDFHVPKKDRCDTCMEYDAQKNANTLNEQLQQKYNLHLKDKQETREERDSDRKLVDDTKAVICFDLQNVLTCPRANISNFFYKRKLNVYNLTAHCATSKKEKSLLCCVA